MAIFHQAGPLLQAREPPVVVVARTANARAETGRDVAQAQFLEAGELQRRTLAGRKLGQAGADHPFALFP